MSKILCLTGLSGAGKTEILRYCGQKDIAHFYTGDIIPADVDEARKIDFGDSLKEENGFIKLALERAFADNSGEDLLVFYQICG